MVNSEGQEITVKLDYTGDSEITDPNQPQGAIGGLEQEFAGYEVTGYVIKAGTDQVSIGVDGNPAPDLAVHEYSGTDFEGTYNTATGAIDVNGPESVGDDDDDDDGPGSQGDDDDDDDDHGGHRAAPSQASGDESDGAQGEPDAQAGTDGDDTLVDQSGDSILTGGDGVDLFVIDGSGGGHNTITDFSIAEGDVLKISDVLDMSGEAGTPDGIVSGFDIAVSVEGSDVTLHITNSAGTSDVTLKGINASAEFDGATTLDDLILGGLQVDFNPDDMGS